MTYKPGFDTNGRKYLTRAELVEGMTIELDGGFTCTQKGTTTLKKDSDGSYYFECSHKEHHIAGQAAEDEELATYYIGIYPVTTEVEPA